MPTSDPLLRRLQPILRLLPPVPLAPTRLQLPHPHLQEVIILIFLRSLESAVTDFF
jgi:hypothetical protein